MPFPLAHPAAVLPLRRFCPRYLSFPALVVGSICPDAGYCLGRLNAGDFSHRFWGSFGFCLPVGIIGLILLYGIVLPAVERLPDRYQKLLPPLALRPLGPSLLVLLSLLIGIWTHLLWDSFTHTGGWFVEQLPLLHAPAFHLAGRTVRVCHLLWYGCSFGGMFALFVAYDRWQQASTRRTPPNRPRLNWRGAFLLATLVVPIELIHHLVHGAFGRCLVAALTLAVVAAAALRMRSTGTVDSAS